MNARSIIFSAVCALALMPGCRQKPVLKAEPPASAFACRMIYEDVIIEQSNGERLSVELAADVESVPLKALQSLKPSVQIGLSPSGEAGSKPPLYLIGTLTGEMSKPHQAASPPVPWKARPIFRLEGWFVKMPYTEYPQAPEYKPQPAPRERTTLETTDFEPPMAAELIHHDKARDLFWIGNEPSAEVLQKTK